MIDESVHAWDCPAPEDSEPQRVVTTLRQALTGLQIGLANLQARCTACGQARHEGQQVWVYVYRTADAPEWVLSRCYCSGCAPGCIETPTLGTSEALIEARLDVVSLSSEHCHNLCLSEIEVLTFSPLTEGASP